MRRRAAREGATPLLLRIYGLKPWELSLLTGREAEQIIDDMNRIVEERA